MHIHAGVLASNNRARIDSTITFPIPSSGQRVTLKTNEGGTVEAVAVFGSPTAKQPSNLEPFFRAPETADSILVTSGPDNKGFVVFKIESGGQLGVAPISGPQGVIKE